MTSIANIRHVVETYETIKYLTQVHTKSKSQEDQYHLEQEIEGILEAVQTRIMPHIGSKHISKKQMYRFNHQFNEGDLIKVVSITIGFKETIIVADAQGKAINISLDKFYKLFKKHESLRFF